MSVRLDDELPVGRTLDWMEGWSEHVYLGTMFLAVRSLRFLAVEAVGAQR